MGPATDTDFLVVGSGPAGAAIGAFLRQNGLRGLAISAASSTAETPRAHVFNPFAMECLRDLGLEDDALCHATRGPAIQAFRWCRSMVGEEYGRLHYWGSHPDTMRDQNVASPCEWTDLPQSYLDPLLVKFASHHGFEMRFSTKLVGIKRSSGVWACEIQDLVSKITYKLRAKYVFGADGGRSIVARSLNFEFTKNTGGGVACNVVLNADLDHLMHPARQADLHWIMKPDLKTRFGISPTLRMIRPWKQWMLVAFTPGATEDPFKDLTPKSKELIDFIRELIGDDEVDIEILRIDPWVLRDSVALKFSKEQSVFLLGDSAHRHPPAFGLGSNTCIQDAYNLRWKVAYVERGLAGKGLLDSYDAERQPVGANVVKDANYGLQLHAGVWEALGMFAPTPDMPTLPYWSKETHLEFMDKAGIAKSILSISSPGTHLVPGNDDLAIRLTRECNEFAAELKRQHPDKFGFWASLPLPHVKGSLDEIAHSFDVLNADGVAVKTNMHGVYVGDPVFDPVFQELNRRRATVFIHPTSPCIGDGHTAQAACPLSQYPNPMLEFFFDTARAVINMFMTGFVDKFPQITVIICHAGGALPPLVERLTNVATAVLGHSEDFNTKEVKRIFSRQFYFDLAGYVFPDQIHGILRYVDASRLLYGTDYPFTPGSGALGMSRIMDMELPRVFPNRDEYRSILAGNAVKVLEGAGGGAG